MRLRANIRRATGNTRHTVHGRDAESAIAWVEAAGVVRVWDSRRGLESSL